jgi:hypothetical protein
MYYLRAKEETEIGTTVHGNREGVKKGYEETC